MQKRQPKGDSGFTLLEILVVIALLGLVSGLVSGGLKTASIAGPHLVAADLEAEELEGICNFLRRLVPQARPVSIGNSGDETVRFHGTSTQVEFLAPLTQRFGPADIVNYVLSFRESHVLQLDWSLDRDYDAASAFSIDFAAPTTELLTGVTEASFHYFGCGPNRNELAWWDNWTEQVTLPALIRVQFAWRGRYEDVIIAPRIEAASGFSELFDAACSK